METRYSVCRPIGFFPFELDRPQCLLTADRSANDVLYATAEQKDEVAEINHTLPEMQSFCCFQTLSKPLS